MKLCPDNDAFESLWHRIKALLSPGSEDCLFKFNFGRKFGYEIANKAIDQLFFEGARQGLQNTDRNMRKQNLVPILLYQVKLMIIVMTVTAGVNFAKNTHSQISKWSWLFTWWFLWPKFVSNVMF